MTATAAQPLSDDVEPGRRRTGLAILAALIAFSAAAGALGLVTGALSVGARLEERLPFGSPAFGGIALGVVVALPSTWLAWLAWRGDRRTDMAALLAGTLLVGWILVELAFIRELSFFHPLYVAIGLVLMVIGRRGVRVLPGPLHHRENLRRS